MNKPMSRSWLDILWSGLSTQASVIRALSIRELQQRFGRDNIGYLWVIAEPMMLASVITMLHSVVAGKSDGGMSPYTFMLTGYSIYIIFRNTFNRGESALHSSETLMYHGMISPFDIMLSKSLVETIGCLSALVFLQSAGIMIGVADFPARPIYLIGAILLFAWFAFGMTLIVSSYAYRSPLMGRLVAPMSYFALPISGAFITMSILPAWTRPYMAWNPMMSVFEMARYGQFQQAPSTYIFPWYVVTVATLASYWGLLEIRRVRKYIHVP
ncbi:ABC transporter permease [Novosphingobium terrae]|uniref:ABC transporter permease n=1 Tax=Novosphingobium terrae TaxID=2726189 RepID=UPI00197E5AEC|nr:ABC transporter permease [Novosphingobium terrae]